MQALNKKDIVLSVDAKTAELFEKASVKERERFGLIFTFLLREPNKNFFLRPNENGWDDLKQRLNKISDEAEEKGLTHEILEEILSEK